MKKISFVSLMSLLFLSCCSLVAYFLRFASFKSAIVPLAIGFGIMVASGVFALCCKKTPANVICYVANSVALGFCIRSWYIFRGFDNAWWVILLVSLACVVYLLVFYALLYIPVIEKHFNLYFWLFFILTLVGYILVVANSVTTFVSTFGYYVIIEIAFIFAMCKGQKNIKEVFRDIVTSTFTVLVVAIIIALIMLECDLDGIDGADFGGEITKRKSPKDVSIDI